MFHRRHNKVLVILTVSGRLDVPVDECDAYLHLARQFKLRQVKKLLERRLVNAKSFGRQFTQCSSYILKTRTKQKYIVEE